ncbi:hypothetical protein Tco_1249926 [Tanacetum coccineum]
MVKFVFHLLDLSSRTVLLYQKLLEFNPGNLVSFFYPNSSLKLADKANSSFRTFEVDKLAAHELFVATFSCYMSFSWSGGIMLVAYASRAAKTLSATSFLMAA